MSLYYSFPPKLSPSLSRRSSDSSSESSTLESTGTGTFHSSAHRYTCTLKSALKRTLAAAPLRQRTDSLDSECSADSSLSSLTQSSLESDDGEGFHRIVTRKSSCLPIVTHPNLNTQHHQVHHRHTSPAACAESNSFFTHPAPSLHRAPALLAYSQNCPRRLSSRPSPHFSSLLPVICTRRRPRAMRTTRFRSRQMTATSMDGDECDSSFRRMRSWIIWTSGRRMIACVWLIIWWVPCDCITRS
ncbi:hypothetical protein C8F01DRAFT_1121275 [Mycena amicta]|nr:hypothetical protein C8F01DRAFT_1121275 [Mycena amicta]